MASGSCGRLFTFSMEIPYLESCYKITNFKDTDLEEDPKQDGKLIQLKLEQARDPSQRLGCKIFNLVTQLVFLRAVKTDNLLRESIRNTLAELHVFTLPFSSENGV